MIITTNWKELCVTFRKIDDGKIEIMDVECPTCWSTLKEEKPILVPENIKIERWCIGIGGDKLWIKFNEWKQSLCYSHWIYKVHEALDNTIQCKLTPCKREDLKPWDTAYCSNLEEQIFNDIDMYCKILNQKECVFVMDNTGIELADFDYDYRYKVEPLDSNK